MQVALAPATLPTLDGLACDLLALGCFPEERPLRGVAGLVDWRLNGWISRLLQQGRFRGSFGEALLFPAGRRLGPSRALLLGLGSLGDWNDDRLGEAADQLWGVVARLKVRDVALAFPLQPGITLPRRRLLPLLSAAARPHLGGEAAEARCKLTVLAPPEELRSMSAALGGKE